jgi:hypothetical protein
MLCRTIPQRNQETALVHDQRKAGDDRRPGGEGTAACEEHRPAHAGREGGVRFTYVSRIENENLDFGPYPSDALFVKLAAVLETESAELALLAKKIQEPIHQRVLERPDAFHKLAALDDGTLDFVPAATDSLGQHGAKGRNPK